MNPTAAITNSPNPWASEGHHRPLAGAKSRGPSKQVHATLATVHFLAIASNAFSFLFINIMA
jgi:hypothetical protein